MPIGRQENHSFYVRDACRRVGRIPTVELGAMMDGKSAICLPGNIVAASDLPRRTLARILDGRRVHLSRS